GSNKIPLGLKSHCSMNNNKDNIIISDNTSSDTSSTHSNTPNNQNRQGDWDEINSRDLNFSSHLHQGSQYRNHNYITQAQNNGKSHEDSIRDKINNNSTREYPNAYNKNDTPEQQHLQDIDDQVMQDINDLLNMERNRFINEQQNQLQKAKFPTISFATHNING
ncbi:2691_t:CDS:2, partial [Rhizophagus irregularis]